VFQEAAPQPKCVEYKSSGTTTDATILNKPEFYGREFHGDLSREKADILLEAAGEGAYLVNFGFFVLSFFLPFFFIYFFLTYLYFFTYLLT